jgi:hypothetical protein
MEELWIDDVIDFTTQEGWQKGMARLEAEHKAARFKNAQRSQRALLLDVGSPDLATKDTELYCTSCQSTLIGQRKRKKDADVTSKKADAGTPRDVDRDAVALAAQREPTYGGLYEPIEDDRQPIDLAAEFYYGTKGGLFTPDKPPSTEDKLRALWNEQPIAWQRSLSTDQRAYRETHGGLFTPEP